MKTQQFTTITIFLHIESVETTAIRFHCFPNIYVCKYKEAFAIIFSLISTYFMLVMKDRIIAIYLVSKAMRKA